MSSDVSFEEGCRALDDALTSDILRDRDSVAALVHRREEARAAELNGDAGATASPAWLDTAVEHTWGVLEVMRSAIGEWQEDTGPSDPKAANPSPSPASAAGKQSHGHRQHGSHGHHSHNGHPHHAEHQHSVHRKHSRRAAGRPGGPGPGDAGALPHADSGGKRVAPGSPPADAHASIPWNVQEQGKQHRVLYRPGPEGAPFHTLLLEGVLPSSVGTALSVCWEAPYYTQWWPQFTVPPFKVTESRIASQISPNHALSVTRLKVPWPFAARELGLSSRLAFVDPASGLAIVTIRTLPEDASKCSAGQDGFDADAAPRVPPGVVRLDVDGGYCFKRLSDSLCYFRGFVNLDMKLDVVPVWVINFINRTLAGTGFQLLMQVVRDAVTGQKGIGATFQKIMEAEDSLYREVDSTLCALQDAAPAQGGRPGVHAGAELGQLPEEAPGQDTPQAPLGLEAVPSAGAGAGAPAAWEGEGDPELQDALQILEEAIQVIQSDALSVYSEMTAASSRGAPSRAGGGLPQSTMADAALATTRPVASGRKRWWRFLRVERVQKLKPVGE